MVFAEPTVNDHLSQTRDRLDEGRKRLQRKINVVQEEFSQHDAYGGSRMFVALADAFTTEFDATVRHCLEQLSRSLKSIRSDRNELRSITQQELSGYARELRQTAFELCDPNRPFANASARQLLMPEVEKLGQRLSGLMRQFDIGFLDITEPGTVSVTNNTLNIETNVGAVQQGSHNSKQNVAISLDAKFIGEALDAFQRELVASKVEGETKDLIAADIETVRSQIKKPSLNQTLLREAGRSIRAVVEGVAAGVMTPQALAAAAALWKALGAA